MSTTDDLPPSALYALDKLESVGELTHQDLVDETGMRPRTVTRAVERLLEEDLIASRYSCRDARRVFYCPDTAD